MIKNIAVCEITDLYFFAVDHKIADWNEIQQIIYSACPAYLSDGREINHRHWFKDTFVITQNFFNPEYKDDAYGLQWHPKVQQVVKEFMEFHKLKKFVVCTTKNQSLLEL